MKLFLLRSGINIYSILVDVTGILLQSLPKILPTRPICITQFKPMYNERIGLLFS